MVYYYTCIDPEYTVYMGEDKYENEELIKYHWPEDVWFHVDKHSSAHVYIRLKPNETIHSLPANVLEDMAQLTKENSIEGKKLNNIRVVYTMASNLKKTADMAVGAVSYHDSSKVYTVNVPKRNREIVNRLAKTKREEVKPNFAKMKEDRDRNEREQKKKEQKEKRTQEKKLIEEKKKEAELKSYSGLFSSEKMQSNKGTIVTAKGKKKFTTVGAFDDVFAEDGEGYLGTYEDLDDFI